MNNLLYAIAVFLIIIWAIGYLGFNVGGLIHILLVIAVISVLMRIIQGSKKYLFLKTHKRTILKHTNKKKKT